MSTATTKTAAPPPDRVELAPLFFEPERIVTPADNPAYTPAMLADLLESVRAHGQLVPGWVCPAPELTADQRLCLEGNRRLAVTRLLGLPFWAFDLGRFVPEDERIRLMFQHHSARRVMSREEIAERAARYIELTGCTAAEAAKHLNVSGPTLSRAFGERRIPPELRPRAEQLGLAVRSLVAAAPPAAMTRAIAYAEAPGPDGKRPTRDQVALFLRQLKEDGRSQGRRPRAVTLRHNGRAVTLAVESGDSAGGVADDLRALAARLVKHADVPPDGWPFLFQ